MVVPVQGLWGDYQEVLVAGDRYREVLVAGNGYREVLVAGGNYQEVLVVLDNYQEETAHLEVPSLEEHLKITCLQ